jgi:hypothetical protein
MRQSVKAWLVLGSWLFVKGVLNQQPTTIHEERLSWGRPLRVLPAPTSSGAALWEAKSWRFRAQLAVNQERYDLEARSPEMAWVIDQDQWRRQLMAADPGGYLGQAMAHAQQAEALARTPEEQYQAIELLANIECDCGHHRTELELARRLMAIDPRQTVSLLVLRRAAHCNRQPTGGLRVEG